MRLVSVVNSIALRKATAPLRIEAGRQRRSVERRLDRDVVDERDELLARCAPARHSSIRFWRRFSCLISPARASSVSRSPYSLMSCAAVLMPMPGTPGTLSVESPASACTSTTRSGADAELLDHLGLADDALGARALGLLVAGGGVEHHDAGPDQLHQVLVGRDDGDVGAGLAGLAAIGRDEVVGLVADPARPG